MSEGDSRQALMKTLALISGCHQDPLPLRSLQSGQPKQVTFQIDFNKKFRTLGDVWNTLRRYFQKEIIDGVYGMKPLANYMGAIFDIKEVDLDLFEQTYLELSGMKSGVDFKLYRCTYFPDIKEFVPQKEYN